LFLKRVFKVSDNDQARDGDAVITYINYQMELEKYLNIVTELFTITELLRYDILYDMEELDLLLPRHGPNPPSVREDLLFDHLGTHEVENFLDKFSDHVCDLHSKVCISNSVEVFG
jgi:hypothetical protein